MLRNIEIIRFACGLTADSLSVLEHAYDVAVRENLNNGGMLKNGYFELSEFYELWAEISPEKHVVTTHNEFVNVMDVKTLKIFGWEKEIQIPSRYYVFKNLREPISNELKLKSHPS